MASPWDNLTPIDETQPPGTPSTGLTPSAPSVAAPWAGLSPLPETGTVTGVPSPPVQGPPFPTADYSALDAAAHGYSFGLSDAYRAATTAANRYFKGETPGFDYPQAATEIQKGREAYAAEHPYLSLGANVTGSLVGPAGYAGSLIKGASLPAKVAISTGTGGAIGGVQGAADNPNDPLTGARIGAEWGTGTGAAFPIIGGIGSTIFPGLSPEVRALRAAGVQPTPGAVGGVPGAVETAFSHIPIVGAPVKAGQTAALTSQLDNFNREAVNQPLAAIGETLNPDTATGHAAIAEMQTKLSNAYNQAVPTAGGTIDSQALTSINDALANAKLNLEPEQLATFQRLVQNRITGKLQTTPTGTASLSGPAFQDIDQYLGQQAHKMLQSDNPFYNNLGDAYLDLQGKMRDWLERVSPQNADDLRAANQAWRLAKPVENAARATNDPQGLFTTAQLRSGARSASSTSQFAAGGALMQNFADNAEMQRRVLPVTSGGHGADVAGAAATGSAVAGALFERPELLTNPWLLGSAAALYPALKGVYSEPGRKIVTGLLGATGSVPPAIGAFGPVAAQFPQYAPGVGNFTSGLLNPNPTQR